jgi:hypothetical protein
VAQGNGPKLLDGQEQPDQLSAHAGQRFPGPGPRCGLGRGARCACGHQRAMGRFSAQTGPKWLDKIAVTVFFLSSRNWFLMYSEHFESNLMQISVQFLFNNNFVQRTV